MVEMRNCASNVHFYHDVSSIARMVSGGLCIEGQRNGKLSTSLECKISLTNSDKLRNLLDMSPKK